MIEIPHRKVKDGIIVEVRVDPRSSRREIAGALDSVVKVRLTAPPVGGAANEQLVEVLSEAFGVRKSDVTILKGAASRHKLVKVRGVSFLPSVARIPGG
ncbi:MAG TPA: DUF167 domain-containing protein [Dissulfurispiraceae bacterium]|nr:DUF167 domain-containing protein [Dissulfurispiraceae bacterium]